MSTKAHLLAEGYDLAARCPDTEYRDLFLQWNNKVRDARAEELPLLEEQGVELLERSESEIGEWS